MESYDGSYEGDGYHSSYGDETDSGIVASGFEKIVYVTIALLSLVAAAMVYATFV